MTDFITAVWFPRCHSFLASPTAHTTSSNPNQRVQLRLSYSFASLPVLVADRLSLSVHAISLDPFAVLSAAGLTLFHIFHLCTPAWTFLPLDLESIFCLALDLFLLVNVVDPSLFAMPSHHHPLYIIYIIHLYLLSIGLFYVHHSHQQLTLFVSFYLHICEYSLNHDFGVISSLDLCCLRLSNHHTSILSSFSQPGFFCNITKPSSTWAKGMNSSVASSARSIVPSRTGVW